MTQVSAAETDRSTGHPAVLVVVCSALFFGVVNGSAVAVVLPEIGADLNIAASDLSSALSLNTMMFFIGGSFGATLFSLVVINTGENADAFNPLHDSTGSGFSNAFAVLAIPVAIGLALSTVLPRKQATGPSEHDTDDATVAWVHDCQVPWCPEVERELVTASPAGDQQ